MSKIASVNSVSLVYEHGGPKKWYLVNITSRICMCLLVMLNGTVQHMNLMRIITGIQTVCRVCVVVLYMCACCACV